MPNRSELHAKEVLIVIQTPMDLAKCVLLLYVAVLECCVTFETQFKCVSM